MEQQSSPEFMKQMCEEEIMMRVLNGVINQPAASTVSAHDP